MRSIEERFWSKVDRRGPDECWEWRGAFSGSGYGHLRVNGRLVGAHRVAFFAAHMLWPEPMCLHRCDNPRCVNPAHLYEGTQRQNMKDRDSRGRHYSRTRPERVPRGSTHWNARLCPATVGIVRMLVALGARKTDVASWIGVSKATVTNVVSGKSWKVLQ